jgi:transposase
MSGKIRKNHSDVFKAKVALSAIKSDKTVIELCQEFGVAASQIYSWRDRLLENSASIFADKRTSENHQDEVAKLHKVIGKLTVENDFLSDVFNRLK